MKNIFLFSAVVFISSFSFGQSDRIDFDYSVFLRDDGGLLELYYSFFKVLDKDKVLSSSKNEKTEGSLDVKIQNASTNELVVNKNWQFNYDINGNSEDSHKAVSGVLKYFLAEGKYNCTLVGKSEITSTKSDSFRFDINVEKLSKNGVAISGIEIASSISQFSQDTTSIFYKNTLEVIPNPSLIYGDALPALYYYAEIYNLDKIVEGSKVQVELNLLNAYQEIVYKKSKRISTKNSSIVEQGALKVNSYPTGAYSFLIAVVDNNDNTLNRSSKKIFLYNPSVVDTTVRNFAERKYTGSEFALLTGQELDDYFEISGFIATTDEKGQWEKIINDQGKMDFLFNFWLIRDPSPESVLNEAKVEYFNRVFIADKNFKSISKSRGSLTERGRVLLTYGHPSDVERHPNDTEKKPYEIWFYDEIEGGVIFVFADFYGYSDYRLIHSTKRNEVKDTYWEQTIATY